MINKLLFSLLLLCCSATNAVAQTALPDQSDDQITIPPEKLIGISLSKEEMFYIRIECKQFAIDDEIEAKFVSDYVEVCAHELAQAVKIAKYRRQQKTSEPRTIKSRRSSQPKPL